MNSSNPAMHAQGISLRQAALIAGAGLLIMAVAAPFAEFSVYRKLVVAGDIEATVQGFVAHEGLVIAAILAYLVTFIFDVVVAWALYLLLAPVNRPLSLLTAWIRLVYTAAALVAMFKLVTVYRMTGSAEYLAIFGTDQLHAQVHLLLNTFRYEWNVSLVLFGIHLGLLGYLVYRSGYIPRLLGVLLVIGGVGWLIYCLSSLLYPEVNVSFIMITFAGELIFMAWLLIAGWRIPEPVGGTP